MEYLPFSLSKCLDKHKNIPLAIKYNILSDVSIGLRFLHEQTPPIIHRDLTANNIMLTSDMRAKIADLGQAKILSKQVAPMTVAPGTSCYMPPETLVQNPTYDAKMDIFSFGVLIIHTVIQEFPVPSEMLSIDPNVCGRLIPQSEVERRQVHFKQMGESNVITSLAKECLNNDPRLRPQLSTITDRLKDLASDSQPAATCRNLLESMEMMEKSNAHIALLRSTLENVEIQLEVLMQDIHLNISPSEAGLSVIERQLKSVSNLVHSSLNQREAQGTGRLALVYRSSEQSEQNTPIKIERSLSGSGKLTSVIQPPINITFTATYSKTILSDLRSPKGVALSKEGLVCVCDELGWKAVHMYNPNSTQVKAIVDSASPLEYSSSVPDEKCWHPSGIAVDQNDNILLSDTGSHRILKFSPEGTLLATAGKKYEKGGAKGEFNEPKGIAVASNGNVFVCDRDNHQVQVLDSGLKFERAFGKYGKGPAEFYHPTDVAFDSAGNIYVVDSSNYCVKVFTPTFEPLRQIGSEGNQYHNFRAPMNICIDSNDIVYVTDKSKHCVMVFDQMGVFKMHFGNWGKRIDGLFNHPMGIAVDAQGHVYVCDKLNGCVQIFI